MSVMISPNTVMGAFTGDQTPAQGSDSTLAQAGQNPPTAATSQDPVQSLPAQPPQDVSAQPPVAQETPVQGVQQSGQPTQAAGSTASEDALSVLESLVAERTAAQAAASQQSASTPTTQQQPPQPVVQPQAQQQPEPQTPQSTQPPQPVQQDGVSPQAVLTAVQTAPDPLNPANPAPASAKETFERPAAPDTSSIDVGGAIQHVESEKNPEIPVEVEGFLQRVQDFSQQKPQEVVIADGTTEQAGTNYPSRPVIVLPITEEVEKKGKSKSPKYSIRWLVEWSHKIIKMFAGKVVYRPAEESEN